MKKIKFIVYSVLLIIVSAGLFLFVRYELQVRKDLRQLRTFEKAATYEILLTKDFIVKTFPEQVKLYNESLPQ